MDFKKKHEAYKKRFGIADMQTDPTKEFQTFKKRILNIFEGIDMNVEEREIVRFCTRFGQRVVKLRGETKYAKNIFGILEAETDEEKFYFLVEALFTLHIVPKYNANKIIYSKGHLYEETIEAFRISDINASITATTDGEIIVFPRGEEILDKALVEAVFRFLDPKSQNHLLAALKSYKEGTNESHIKSAESIRRCVEEFLRFKLSNTKSLSNNIRDILVQFKDQTVSNEIKNILQQNLTYLDKYFNEHSKHNDGKIGEAENEFLLYQAGLLMRYISKII